MSNSVETFTAMIYRLPELFDTGDFDAFAEQFAHGSWHRAGTGTATIRRWLDENVLTYDGLPRTKHLTNNLIVEVDEKTGTATASSYVTVLQALPDLPLQPIFAGRYKDRLERVDGQWRWVERAVIADLYGDTTHHTRSPDRPMSTSLGHDHAGD